MRIGVGVEGPADREFWKGVLPKHFQDIQFDVRNMKTKEELIRATPQLLESFRSLRYAAGFIFVDRHQDPCITAVLQRFDHMSQAEARKPTNQRYLFICVAIRGLEAWYLADPSAIARLFPKADYVASEETATLNPKLELAQLWKKQFGQNSALNKIGFAKMMAPRFDPEQSGPRSASFGYFWARMTAALQS